MNKLFFALFISALILSDARGQVCGITHEKENRIYESSLPTLIDIFKAIVSGVAAGSSNNKYGLDAIVRGREVIQKAEDVAMEIQNDPNNTTYRATIYLFAEDVAQGDKNMNEGMKEAWDLVKTAHFNVAKKFDQRLFERQFKSAVKNGSY